MALACCIWRKLDVLGLWVLHGVCRRTSWRCFLAAVCSTFTLQTLSKNASHGMISFTGVHTYENKDWLYQLPFILINAGKATRQRPPQLTPVTGLLTAGACCSGCEEYRDH